MSNTAIPVDFRPDVRPARLLAKQIAKTIAVELPPRHDHRRARHISRKTLDSHHHSLSFHRSDGISVPDCRLQRRLRRRKFTHAALASIRRQHTLSADCRFPGPEVTVHAPVDRSPLHHHPELHCSDALGVADLLASKGFDLILPRYREGTGGMRINAIDLPSIHLCYVGYGTEAVAKTTPARPDYRIQLPLAGRSVSVMGRMEVACADTQGVVSSPVCDQTIHSAADSRRLMMYFAGEALTRHLSAMLGEAIVDKVRFEPALDLTRGAGRSLRRWVMLAVEELNHGDALLANPLAMAQFEQLLLTGLVCGQPHNYSELLDGRSTVSPRSVRRAVDYIHANLHLPITAEQLVAAAGVPGRTLYAHFRQATGLAPLAYVRKARYERVRRELLAGTGEHLTDVAARWGFEHMGRFALGYRTLFGERPSDTMRRR